MKDEAKKFIATKKDGEEKLIVQVVNGRIIYPDNKTFVDMSKEKAFEFQKKLDKMVEIWKENNEEEYYQSFLDELCEEVREEHFGKYSGAKTFYETGGDHNHRSYEANVLNGQVISVRREIYHYLHGNSSFDIAVQTDGYFFERNLEDMIEVWLSEKRIYKYLEFLNCLNEEFKSEYFVNSYIPKSLVPKNML